jgi:hypothetical protein
MASAAAILDTVRFHGPRVHSRMNQPDQNSDYKVAFNGSFTSALRWHHLDALWDRVRQRPDGWYVYAVGTIPSGNQASEDELLHFVLEIDHLLRTEHDEKYCGIVYADDFEQPSMIKIYDPNNLGVSCGYSDNPPLPGWVLSRIAPVDLQAVDITPNNRKRWWRRIFSA